MEVNLTETWIVIKINGSNYCINSKYVKGISELNTAIYKKPANLSRFIRGNYSIYGAVMPVIDARRVLGYNSVEDEKLKFSDKVHKVIYEHETWIDELEWIVFTRDKFSKSSKYSDSSIIKFLDELGETDSKITVMANKIRKPLEVVYGMANEILELRRKKMLGDCYDKLEEIKRQSNKYVVKNLENIIELNNELYTEACLVIQCKGITFGIAVDSVDMISDKSDNLTKVCKDKVSAGTIQIKSKEYNILNLTKLTNIVKSEEEN